MRLQGLARAEGAPRRLGRRPVLDGMRGIAVLLVMLMHTQVLANGYIGVDLFFGLSGFLITTLLYEEWDRTGGISLRDFYRRRVRRLLPALLILLVGLVAVNTFVYPLTGWSLGKKTLTTLFFANNWVAGLGHSNELGSLTPTWSLGEEEQFYLLWPLALLLMLRRRMSPWTIVALLTGTVLAALAIEPRVAAKVSGYNYYFSPIDRASELGMGCIAAIVWRSRLIPNVSNWPLAPGRLRSALMWFAPQARMLATWALAVGLTLLLLRVPATHLHDRQMYVGAALLGIPLMVLLLGAEHSLLAKLISLRPLRYVGKISYALYLFHLLIRNLVYHYLPGESVLLNAAITIGISMLVAGLSWRLLESKFTARKKAVRSLAEHPQAVRLRPKAEAA